MRVAIHSRQARHNFRLICNLYSELTTTEAMERLRAEWYDYMPNVPPLYAIYPDYTAPIIREPTPSRRTISLARWGLPSLKDPVTDNPNRGNTNIRHPWFDDWKRYLCVEHRCPMPLNRFAEPTKLEGQPHVSWLLAAGGGVTCNGAPTSVLDQSRSSAAVPLLFSKMGGHRRGNQPIQIATDSIQMPACAEIMSRGTGGN